MTADFYATAIESLRSDARKTAVELGITVEETLVMWREDLAARQGEVTTTFMQWLDRAIELETESQGPELGL